MSAIHELRANYRHYRLDNPQYRWLFVLADMLLMLAKLALFAAFLFICWYVVSRGSLPTGSSVAATQPAAVAVPELTEERIALLRRIAGQTSADTTGKTPNLSMLARSDSSGATLLPHSYQIADGNADNSVVGLVTGNSQTPVQVTAVSASDIAAINTNSNIGIGGSANPIPPEAVNESAPNTRARETLGRSWVLQQPPRNYTVQIAMTSNRPFLESFARKLPNDMVTAIFPERVTSNGEVQYSLSLGNFSNLNSAEAALTALPQVHRRYGAHLRRFNQFRDNVSGFSANIPQ